MARFWNGLMISAIVIPLVAAILRHLLSTYIETVSQLAETCNESPHATKANASKVLLHRYKDVKLSFENIMSNSGWKLLREAMNVSIESKETNDGSSLYIRTIATFNTTPQVVFDAFTWANLDATLRLIDPFYESSKLLMSPAKGLHLIRKVRTVQYFKWLSHQENN